MTNSQYRWGIAGLGLLWAGTVILGIWPDVPSALDRQISRFLIAAGISTLIWWVSLFLTTRFVESERDVSDPAAFWMLIGIATIVRIVILVVAPDAAVLSDDVYRYMWDGRMIDLGINPFYFSPDDAILKPLRDHAFYPNINHPWLPTIYPPLAQAFFWVSYKLTPTSILGFKIVSLVMELSGWAAAYWYLAIRKINRHYLIVLVLCPLFVWEFIYSSHLDILALPLLIASLALLAKKRPVAATVILAAAGTIKFFAWFFLPLCFWYMPRRVKILSVLAALLTIAFLYTPLMRAGTEIVGSLVHYLETWRFNGSLYQLAALILGDPVWLRWVLGGLLAIWLIIVTAWNAPAEDRWMGVWLGYSILTTTLFPWYMMWVVPVLLWKRWKPMVWLVGTIFLSYHYLYQFELTGLWGDSSVALAVQYGGFYTLLGVWGWTAWRDRSMTHRTQLT